ncbi:MAG: sulfite exporter TauE/SafE family protein [Deferribacteraceae bacterium]|jgi:sulfite exporter TauE/SafE|nr:sulfite exporter TauE/SafE family protein [Deferribacteraceae bacterium]
MTEIFVSSFLIGLTGSFAHCAGMCYPFVLYISAKYRQTGYAIIIPQLKYNLGRITTYTVFGAILGSVTGFPALRGILWLQKGFIIAAGVVLILLALKLSVHLPALLNFSFVSKLNSAYLTGVILGFLPCGLLAGGLITSAMARGASRGAIAMLCFGLGTSVSLLIMALTGGLIEKYIPWAKYAFRAVLLISGVYLIYKGITLAV